MSSTCTIKPVIRLDYPSIHMYNIKTKLRIISHWISLANFPSCPTEYVPSPAHSSLFHQQGSFSSLLSRKESVCLADLRNPADLLRASEKKKKRQKKEKTLLDIQMKSPLPSSKRYPYIAKMSSISYMHVFSV